MLPPPPPSRVPAPQRLPRARDPWMLLAMGLAVALQLWTWSRLDGYELADVIEYMDRADQFVRGEPLDPGTLRSFAFSALLVPLFWVVQLLGLHDGVAVDLARLLQMAFALGAMRLVALSAARLGGRSAGVGAAFVLAVNPVLAQYAVTPLSGTAALFFIALGTDLLLREPQLRRALAAGAALGAAVLMAYQCLPIAVPIAAIGWAQRGWRHMLHAAALVAGFAALILLQCLSDWAVYGTFGSSMGAYLAQNVYGVLATKLLLLGLEGPARFFYDRLVVVAEDGTFYMEMGPYWYLTELAWRCLVPGVLFLIAIGVLASLRRGRRVALVLFLLMAANVWLMSAKGSKSFRLWLPLLPILATVGGLGFGALVSGGQARWLARTAAVLALAFGLAGGIAALERTNLTKFGPYWHAVDILARELRPLADAPPARFASSYHWAVRFRAPQHLELVKLPHHLDRWPLLESEERAEVVAFLADLDGLVGHLQSFSQDPVLLAEVNRCFEVVDVIDGGPSMEELQPVFVFRRRTGSPLARTLYEVYEDTGPGEPNEVAAYVSRIAYPSRVDFRRVDFNPPRRQMEFLGFDVDLAVSSGRQVWLTYHWLAGPNLEGSDYGIVDRVTDDLGSGWNQNHQPTLGAYPTSRWKEGTIVRESLLTSWPEVPSQFGGGYLRGELVAVHVWLAIGQFDQEYQGMRYLTIFAPSGERPLVRSKTEAEMGRKWSPDGLLQVGGFWWAPPAERRLPDDGRPFPGER